MRKKTLYLLSGAAFLLSGAASLFANNNYYNDCPTCRPKPRDCPPQECPSCPPRDCPACKPKPRDCPPQECPSCPTCTPRDCAPPRQECPPKPNCCPSNCCTGGRIPQREITPSAGPCVNDGADVFITGEFIYWTAREDHLGYVTSSGIITTEDPPTTTSSRGKVYHPDWRFKPGFKVGLGMNFDHDGWDVFARYTWFRMRDTDDSTTPSSNRVLVDHIQALNTRIGSAAETGDGISVARLNKWDLNFDVIDLELGRNFYISRCLKLRPHFGFKGTWQKQKYEVTFNTTATDAEGITTTSTATIDKKLDYWGIGIRAGLDTSWQFTRCFSLFGNIAISGLWEKFDSKRFDIQSSTSLDTTVVESLINVKDTFHTIKPVIEWIIGLRYDAWFCCDQYHFGLDAGWEMQFWADQNQFYQVYVETYNGDLILQGLTVKARFSF